MAELGSADYDTTGLPPETSTVVDSENVPDPELMASVVIPCHTERRFDSIVAAVSSVQAQQVAPELIVVAVDHNPELSRRLRAALAPAVVVTDNLGEMRGASATRNAGAELTTTPIVAFLDDDETAEPEWLGRLVAPLADPTLVGTGGRYVPSWETRKPRWFPDVFAWVVGGHYAGMPESNAIVRNVWAGNMAVRTKQFWAVGGFLVGFGKNQGSSQPEDTGLCIAMHRHSGGHWMYVPSAVINHAVPADRSTVRFFVRRCFAEGHGKVVLRAQLPDQTEDPTLSEERLYIKQVLPKGIVTELGMTTQAVSRVLAIVAGAIAAALGAMTAEVQGLLTSRRRGG